MKSDKKLIQVNSLSHTYMLLSGELLHVLENISFDIDEGQLVAVVGPSGCGKTTLIKAICGLLQPSCGQIFINGLSPNEACSKHWIGHVDQQSTLFPHLTVFENITLPLKITSSLKQHNAEWVLEFIGLTEFKKSYPHQLSGGMRQRVALARSLVLKPRILLMDEPFSALDELLREKMSFEFAKMQKEIKQTVIFITHSIDEAVSISDAIIVLGQRPSTVKSILRLDHLKAMENVRTRTEYFECTKAVRKLFHE